MAGDPQISEVFINAAREIHAAPTLEETLEAIVRCARDSLPGIDHVSLSVATKDGALSTLAATDEHAIALDKMQYDAGEGPCLYAMEADAIVRVEHARHEQRWPAFVKAAVAAGLEAMMGVRLYLDEGEMAALNLYSTSEQTLDPGLEAFSEMFACYASMALGRARREDQLNRALVSRRLIGQATGIIMERYGVPEDRAFRYLTRVSNDTNVKLRDLAAEIVGQSNQRAEESSKSPLGE